jgi:hypothetical protein
LGQLTREVATIVIIMAAPLQVHWSVVWRLA